MKKLFAVLLICSLALAETVISPNMNLPVPVVGTTPGPTWANNINSCMTAIDEHDHTPGKGVPISSEAISISSDLSLNGNSLTSAKAVVFSSQASFATSKSIYVIDPDIYYNDGNGNVIQITQNGSVSGASGTITGLPSGTASASYQSVGGTFQFQSATNTPANITGASISIAQQTTTPNTITFKSPNSLAASYNVTWPTAVPSYTSLLAMSTSGVLSTVPYKVPTQQQFTTGSGTYNTPSGPAPVYLRVRLCGGGGGGAAVTTNNGATGSNTTFGNLTGSGGPGGTSGGGAAGGGGSSSVGAGWTGVAMRGNGGTSGSLETGSSSSSSGGGSPIFGGGAAATYNAVGNAGATNSGAGGGGAGGGGAGGGSGGCVDAITSGAVSATYSYSVGAGGAGGAAGSVAGGDGGSGLIVVDEYYQ